MKSLHGRVALITGGASGIGFGVATVLRAEGASVVIADVDERRANEAVLALGGGPTAATVVTDVTSRASVDAAMAAAMRMFGSVDIVVANAGIYPSASAVDIDDAFWDRIVAVNLKGALHCVQASIPIMRERGYGRIVLMSSITGTLVGAPGYSAYGATKAAMTGLMRSVALEVARDGITVNSVLPGNIETPGFRDLDREHQDAMLAAIPMGRLGDPLDVGWAVRFLASEEASFVTGQTLVTDGGQVLPEKVSGA